MSVDRAGDRLVSAPRLVLVDHRRTLAVVTQASHQVLDANPAGRCKRVPGVTQVVKMHVSQSGRLGRTPPATCPVEVATPERRTLWTREHERGGLWPDKDGQVLTERGNDRFGNTDYPASSTGLHWTKRDLAARRPGIRKGDPDPDQPRLQVDIGSCQCRHLPPPQAGKGGEQHQGAEPAVVVAVRLPGIRHLPESPFSLRPRPVTPPAPFALRRYGRTGADNHHLGGAGHCRQDDGPPDQPDQTPG